MITSACARNRRISAQKCRLVADLVRGRNVETALQILQFCRKKAALLVKKTLESAIANADHNDGADIDRLVIEQIYVDKATSLKRFTARAKGRGNRLEKQACHINIILGLSKKD